MSTVDYSDMPYCPLTSHGGLWCRCTSECSWYIKQRVNGMNKEGCVVLFATMTLQEGAK